MKKEKTGNWKYALAAFAFPFLVGIIICIGVGVYPFGDQCMLHVDMYHQYCPFYTEFLDKLQNGGSLMYSWHQGVGADYLALYTYYLASPLNLLLLIWPSQYVIEFMTLMILLKMGLAGLFFFAFLKDKFDLTGKDGKLRQKTALPAVLWAGAYAMSGFVAAYNWDIMWMDTIAMTPLVFLGLDRLVRKQKPGLYYLALALAIWSNYYMSIMLCMGLVGYFFVLFFQQKEKKVQALLRFGWYSLLAGGTSAVLLLPEYLVLSYSGSQGISFPEAMHWYFDFFSEIARSFTLADPYTGAEHWPNLYAGTFSLVLLLTFFCNRRIKWSSRIWGALGLVFFWLSFSNNYLDFIWHGFHFPDSLPGRESFLYIYLVLCLSYASFRKWKGVPLWAIPLSMGLMLVAIVGGYLTSDPEITSWYAFAVTGIFLLGYVILMLITKCCGVTYRKIAHTLFLLLAAGDIIVNLAVTGFYTSSRTTYTLEREDYQNLLAQAQEDADGEFYRVENVERKTKNDGDLYGYASATEFSSLMDINVSHFYQMLYMEGGKNFYCYNGFTPFSSSLLSVKYMLSDSDKEECAGLRTLIGQSGNYYLYENTYCLPMGFMISDKVADQWTPNLTTRINNINSLASLLGAGTDLMTRVEMDNMEILPGSTNVTVSESGYYYAAYETSCASDILTLTTSSGRSLRYSKTTHRYLLELGYFEEGESFSISNSKNESISFDYYCMDPVALEKTYDTLNSQTMNLTKWEDTNLAGTIQVEEPGKLILSVAAEPGWTLYVDGEETEYDTFGEAWIAVELPKGIHSIELKYETPGIRVGGAISGSCLGLFLMSMLVRYLIKKKNALSKSE